MLNRFVHIVFYSAICLEIVFNQFLGLSTAYSHTLCQTKSRYAVYDTEISGFGFASLCFGNLIYWFVEYLGSSCGMDVMSQFKILYHIFILTQMCHDTEFNL